MQIGCSHCKHCCASVQLNLQAFTADVTQHFWRKQGFCSAHPILNCVPAEAHSVFHTKCRQVTLIQCSLLAWYDTSTDSFVAAFSCFLKLSNAEPCSKLPL